MMWIVLAAAAQAKTKNGGAVRHRRFRYELDPSA
jgi:hypothetical protein